MRLGWTMVALAGLASAMAGCTCAVDPDHYLNGRRDAGPLDDGEIPDGGPDAIVNLPDAGDAGPPTDPLPPVASGVGLSSYHPELNSSISAIVGPYFDPNRDAVTVSYQWYKNDSPITAGTAQALTLMSGQFAAGDAITLTVTFSDGALTTMRQVGPAIIQSDVIGNEMWEVVLPSHGRLAGNSEAAFDPTRQRFLWRAEAGPTERGVWEYQLPTTGTSGRWVRLFGVQGAEPTPGGGTQIADPSHDRILFYGGRVETSGADMRVNQMWALQQGVLQGSEAWAMVPTAGTPPGPRDASAVLRGRLPSDEEVVFFYGGVSGPEDMQVVENDFAIFHLDTNAWESTTATRGASGVALPTMFLDQDHQRLYLAGGATFGIGGITGSDEVYVMDLGAIEAGFVDAGWTVPSARFGGSAIVRGHTVFIVGGASSYDGSVVNSVTTIDRIELDPATGDYVSSTTTSASVAVPPQPVGLADSRAPFADTWILFSRGFDAFDMTFHEVSSTDASMTPVTGPMIDMPPPLQQGVAAGREGIPGAVFVGGRQDYDGAGVGNGDAWAWDGTKFERLTVGGTGPGPRWGFNFDASAPYSQHEVFSVGGLTDGVTTTSMDIDWLRFSDMRWAPLALGAGMEPAHRVGHTLFRAVCGDGARGNVFAMVGGGFYDTQANETDTMAVECDTPMGPTPWSNCEWFVGAQMTNSEARRYAAVIELDSRTMSVGSGNAFLIGGQSNTGQPTNDVMMVDACFTNGSPQIWRTVATSGESVPMVFGHSLTGRIEPVTPPSGPYGIYDGYLVFGGRTPDGRDVSRDVYRVYWDGDRLNPELQIERPTVLGASPEGRMFHIAAYDEERESILIYGGLRDERVDDELLELRLPHR
ncbi:MAG: hypothetical protein AB7S26_19170 [Sandaracinaceae bacterium]